MARGYEAREDGGEAWSSYTPPSRPARRADSRRQKDGYDDYYRYVINF